MILFDRGIAYQPVPAVVLNLDKISYRMQLQKLHLIKNT